MASTARLPATPGPGPSSTPWPARACPPRATSASNWPARLPTPTACTRYFNRLPRARAAGYLPLNGQGQYLDGACPARRAAANTSFRLHQRPGLVRPGRGRVAHRPQRAVRGRARPVADAPTAATPPPARSPGTTRTLLERSAASTRYVHADQHAIAFVARGQRLRPTRRISATTAACSIPAMPPSAALPLPTSQAATTA